jgi:hypothetical protein
VYGCRADPSGGSGNENVHGMFSLGSVRSD